MKAHFAALLLAALIVLAATVLVITGHPVPSWFQLLAIGAVGGALGLAPSPTDGGHL